MHHPDSEPRPNRPKLSALDKYKGGIFLLALLAASILIAFYVIGRSHYGQKGQTGEAPSSPVVSSTSTVAAFTSPISPVSPVGLAQATPSAIPTDSFTIEATAQRGLKLYQSGDYTEALRLFDTVVEATPREARSYDMRGTIYTALNDYGHALSDYNKAIELDPSYAQAYYNRGRIYSLLKRDDEALSDLQKSIQLDSASFGYRANGNIGLIYHQRGEYDKALDAFAASIAYDGSKADVFYLRGETYTALGKYEAAIADYESAISRFPRYDLAYQGSGYAYYKLAQYDKAVEALHHAAEISPNSPATHLYLALVYLAQNDASRARTEVSQGAQAFTTLSQEDRQLIYTRVTADLKTFAQKNPAMAAEAESMVKQIPVP